MSAPEYCPPALAVGTCCPPSRCTAGVCPTARGAMGWAGVGWGWGQGRWLGPVAILSLSPWPCCTHALTPDSVQVCAAVRALLLRAQHPLRGDHAASAGWCHPAPPWCLHPHRLGEGGPTAPCAWGLLGRGGIMGRDGEPQAGVGSSPPLGMYIRWGWG